MTDVTGFGLAGHLIEMCEGADLSAHLDMAAIPLLPAIDDYLQAACVPGGTGRNFEAYGHKIAPSTQRQQQLLCDPQTSGGLLVAVRPEALAEFHACAQGAGLTLQPIGRLQQASSDHRIELSV